MKLSLKEYLKKFHLEILQKIVEEIHEEISSHEIPAGILGKTSADTSGGIPGRIFLFMEEIVNKNPRSNFI